MDAKGIMKIFEDTAYVRVGGSEAELRTAEYIRGRVEQIGLEAQIVPFEVPMANMQEAVLLADGVEIPADTNGRKVCLPAGTIIRDRLVLKYQ